MSEESLKEIYLTQRKRFGYDRSLSSARWHSFLTRLGMREGSPSTYLQGASIMDFDHFLRMERRLFNLLGLPEAVSEFAIDLVSKNRDSVEPLRRVGFERRQGLSSFSFVECIKSSLKSIRENNSIPPDKLTALMVVITNSTSLFSSRDWSVAGTISTMAGGITMAIYGE